MEKTENSAVPANSPAEVSSFSIYRRLLGQTKPYWAAFLVGLLGYVVYALTQLGWAELMKYIVEAIESKESEARNFLALAIAGLFFIRGVGTFFGNYGISYVARNVVHDLRCKMFNRMLNLDSSYFDNRSSGHILSKFTFDVEQVSAASTDAFKVIVQEGATVIGLLVYLFMTSWKLSLLFIVIAPAIGLVVNYASKRLRKISNRIQGSIGDVTHVASESINGYRAVKTFGGEAYEQKRFQEASRNNLHQSMKLVVTNSVNTPVVQFLVAGAFSIVVWLAFRPEFLGDTSTGDFLAFLTAAALLAKPIRTLTQVNSVVQRGIAGSESVFELIDMPEEEDKGTHSVERVSGKITFEGVSFGYQNSEQPVLTNINLDIEAGQTIALVGRSGAGKTTLVNLLPRFLHPSEGVIKLDGVPIDDYTLASLRQQISIVSQKVTLFNDTVAHNIAYGVLNKASEEEIIAAAKDAYAWEFIQNEPEGLKTLVGQDGVQLSGGQRQRIAIARAFLKNAPILILDEATSALDTEAERSIQKALEQVMQNRTTIVIAHRLSTIENADRILVMDKGKIVEQGNHQQLIQQQGIYAQLHQQKFAE